MIYLDKILWTDKSNFYILMIEILSQKKKVSTPVHVPNVSYLFIFQYQNLFFMNDEFTKVSFKLATDNVRRIRLLTQFVYKQYSLSVCRLKRIPSTG